MRVRSAVQKNSLVGFFFGVLSTLALSLLYVSTQNSTNVLHELRQRQDQITDLARNRDSRVYDKALNTYDSSSLSDLVLQEVKLEK